MNTNGDWPTRELLSSFRFLYGRWILRKKRLMPMPKLVQIPLWSMNTRRSIVKVLAWCLFRFLYGRWIPMHLFVILSLLQVQIPLWSMNTHAEDLVSYVPTLFRFLYGRWIHPSQIEGASAVGSSDSSMVDEYGVPFYTSEDMKQVQIPLWSMNTWS